MFPILSIITLLPLLGGIAILFIPKEHVNAMRWTALAVAWMDLLLALVLMLTYSQADVTASSPIIGSAPNGTFLYNEQITWIASLGINYSLGVDGISLLLVTLTTLLTLVCIGVSFRIEQKVKNYMAFMLLLECGIIGVFLSTNLFLFYIFWEVMLIPAYFLVGGWGGDRRIYAAFKFVLYTSVGSLLMLAGIIALSYYHHQAAGGSYTLDLATLLNSRLDNTVQIWYALTGSNLLIYRDHFYFVTAVAWSPDGKKIASASADTNVQVWNVATGTNILTYRGHSTKVNAVAWSPDGTRIASASDDRTVQVWDATTGETIFTYRGHAKEISSVTWSPNGTRIASAGYDATVHVWNVG